MLWSRNTARDHGDVILAAYAGTRLDGDGDMVLQCLAVIALLAAPAAAQMSVVPQPPPVEPSPSTYPRPLPGWASESREPRAPGVMLGASLGVGTASSFMLDARVGAVVSRRIVLLAEAMGVGSGDDGSWLLGGGVRFMTEWAFIEGRLGRVSQSHSCDFDDPCTTSTALGGALAIGVEVLHSQHAGLDFRIDMLHAFDDTVYEFGLGGSFYIF